MSDQDETKRFMLLLPTPVLDGLKAESKRTGDSINSIVRRLIREFLEKLNDKGQS